MKPPFFIVGSGRSGTTLLSTILNASGEVFVPPESDFIARAYPYFCGQRDFGDDDLRRIAALFRVCSQQDGWELSTVSIISALRRARPHSFAEVNSSIYNAYLDANGLSGMRWGIKRPVLIASLDRIRAVFPNALIVHVVRDGRDVYVSYKDVRDKGFSWGPSGVVRTALYWADAVRRLPTESLSHILEVRYEDLVSTPGETTKKVCRFLGISYNDRMIERFPDLAEARSIISAEHRDTVHEKIFSKIDPGNINRYEHFMSSGKIRVFELLTGPLLERYGYQVKFDSTSKLPADLLRASLYVVSRLFNDSRYRFRDLRQYRRAVQIAGSTRTTTT